MQGCGANVDHGASSDIADYAAYGVAVRARGWLGPGLVNVYCGAERYPDGDGGFCGYFGRLCWDDSSGVEELRLLDITVLWRPGEGLGIRRWRHDTKKNQTEALPLNIAIGVICF